MSPDEHREPARHYGVDVSETTECIAELEQLPNGQWALKVVLLDAKGNI